jgi:hypothetical protein
MSVSVRPSSLLLLEAPMTQGLMLSSRVVSSGHQRKRLERGRDSQAAVQGRSLGELGQQRVGPLDLESGVGPIAQPASA